MLNNTTPAVGTSENR